MLQFYVTQSIFPTYNYNNIQPRLYIDRLIDLFLSFLFFSFDIYKIHININFLKPYIKSMIFYFLVIILNFS